MPQTYQLVMRSGPNPGKTFLLNKNEVYIGRESNNDIVINDAEISRKHARLVLQGSGYILEDLGSTNGTFVGGQRLMGPYTLRPGDLVLLGENVSLAYSPVQFDPNATVVSAPGPVAAPPFEPQPEIPPSPFQPVSPPPQPPPPPSFSGQVPPYGGQMPSYQEPIPPAPAPVESYQAPEKKGGARNWILAGCGCLVLLILCSAVTLYVIDYLNLWCQIFGFVLPQCRQ